MFWGLLINITATLTDTTAAGVTTTTTTTVIDNNSEAKIAHFKRHFKM